MPVIKTESGTQFAYIYGDGEKLGDITLFATGTACVMNEWAGLMQWFDDEETGHADALRYVRTRMTPNPRFV